MKRTSRKASSRLLRPQIIVLAAIGLCLASLVVEHTGTAFIAARQPALALAIKADEPAALIVQAQQTLEAALKAAAEARAGAVREVGKGAVAAAAPEGDAAYPVEALGPGTEAARTIEGLARRTLAAAPFEARALRLLAQLADAEGDKPHKRKLLEAIVSRSKDEPLAVYWLMLEALQQADHGAVVHYADMLLSKNSTLDSVVVPVLVRGLESIGGADELRTRLQENPTWRLRFFNELPAAASDTRTPLEILIALKSTASPPTRQEVAAYLDFLIGRKLYDASYYAWLQFLEPGRLARLTQVNNGGFEDNPEPVPFDWSLPASSGGISEIASPPGESGRALRVSLLGPGRVELQPVQQIVLLSPGRYRLSLRQKGEVIGRRGVQWTVTCAEQQAKLAETPMFVGAIADWVETESEFVVPEEGCRAQALRLVLAARTPSEQIVKGAAWFDDVRIARIDAP